MQSTITAPNNYCNGREHDCPLPYIFPSDSPDSEARPLGGCCVGMRHMDFFFSFSPSPLASMRRSIMNMTHFSSRPSSARVMEGLSGIFFAFLRAKKALMAKVKWWSKTRFPSLSLCLENKRAMALKTCGDNGYEK